MNSPAFGKVTKPVCVFFFVEKKLASFMQTTVRLNSNTEWSVCKVSTAIVELSLATPVSLLAQARMRLPKLREIWFFPPREHPNQYWRATILAKTKNESYGTRNLAIALELNVNELKKISSQQK